MHVWNYQWSIAKRIKVEKEADEIAIEKGYGEDLVQERIYKFQIDDEETLETWKQYYQSPETLRASI